MGNTNTNALRNRGREKRYTLQVSDPNRSEKTESRLKATVEIPSGNIAIPEPRGHSNRVGESVYTAMVTSRMKRPIDVAIAEK